MVGEFKVEVLTYKLATEIAVRLAELDSLVYHHLGKLYADTIWQETNFLRPLPQKWNLSHIAWALERDPVGFWIVSKKSTDLVHTHRVAVHPRWQGHGVGQRLLKSVLQASQEINARQLTLMVIAGNRPAISFYERLGFSPLAGQALVDFALLKANVIIQKNQLLIGEYTYIALEMKI